MIRKNAMNRWNATVNAAAQHSANVAARRTQKTQSVKGTNTTTKKATGLPERGIYYAGDGTGKHPGALVKSSEHYVPRTMSKGPQGKGLQKQANALNNAKKKKDLKFAQQYLG